MSDDVLVDKSIGGLSHGRYAISSTNDTSKPSNAVALIGALFSSRALSRRCFADS